MTALLIVLGCLAACALLLADGKRSNRRHEEWRRRHGYPPYKR